MKRQNSQQLAARRREVVRLIHKGGPQAAIARHLKIPPGTVSRDRAAMQKFWRDFPVHDFENVRLEQLQKIDVIEAEAWAAWERSRQRRQVAQLTRGKAGEQTRTSLQDQHGDPRTTQMQNGRFDAPLMRLKPLFAQQRATLSSRAEPFIKQ